MKLSRLILLFLTCTVFSVLLSCAETSDKDSKYAIVISTDASDTEVYAAQILSEFLSALDGDDYPIINDDQTTKGFKFCVGATSVYDTSDIADKTADSYIIAPFSNGLAIYGAGSRGTVYGVISFLEDFCGYRYYVPESGIVSTSGKMMLPEERIEYNTFFEYRDTDWRSGWYSQYSLANKLNGMPHQPLADEQGGGIAYLGDFCHTLSTIFCSSEKYFEGHPDYFALHDGKRVPDQLCLTNNSVYEIVLGEVLSLLRSSHNPNADLQIISLSQADNMNYCECDTCKALDSANGSHAGSMITFVNRIAHAIKEKGYDNVEFDTLAYMYTRSAPSAVVPEDNVIIRLCTFECCFSHPMDDPDCPENAKLMKDLVEWSKISNKLYIWDYSTNYAFTLGIFPDFHVLQKDLQCFYEHGVKGVYEEGNYYVPQCDTEFGDLRTYLIAKLLEDPYCDYEAEMLDFCRYYYGGGGEHIKTAIDKITANTKEHVTIYSPMTESFSIDEKEAEEIDQLWSMAEDAAGSSDALAVIERSKLSWRYVKAALGLREFKGTLEENRNEREALYNDLISHGVQKLDEWNYIEQDFTIYELIPVEGWIYASQYYYVRYDLNGGTGGPPNQWCGTDPSWIPEIIPTRSGYRFLGWATEKNAVTAEYFPGGFVTASSNMFLYAVWEKTSGSGDSGYTPPFSSYDLYIAGEKVTSQNAELLQDLNDVTLRDGGHIRYDDSHRTLYLKDVDIIPSKDSKNEWATISYNSQDNTALTIVVEGFCRMESKNNVQDSAMVIAVWGNLNINLQEGSTLEIDASPCKDAYTNIGIYIVPDDSDGILTVSGPGTLKVSGGDARSDNGTGIALYTQGDIVFEKDCTVNIVSDTSSANNIGCWFESGDLTLKDGSQIQINGGESGISYGMKLTNDAIFNVYTENWTGSMSVSGSYGAIRYERELNTVIRKDSEKIRLIGYTDMKGQGKTLLEKETYKCDALQKFTKLTFEGLE